MQWKCFCIKISSLQGRVMDSVSPVREQWTWKVVLSHIPIILDGKMSGYRNLALNVYDQHQIKDGYPHAAANVETRGETVFAAQNAIDGVVVNCHGEWPYQSWGIDRKEDAKIKIEFGRLVEIDRIVLYTRADFPHDNWWKSVNFTFSDESELEMELEKSALPHEIEFPAKRVSWLEMNHMVKSEELSPFPALTQIEVSGREIKQ